MNDPAAERASTSTANLGELLESTLNNAKTLLQAELSLAKRELSSELTSMLSSVGLLIAGAFFLQAALTTLGVLLVMAFGVGIGAVAVVVVLAGIGAALLVVALRALERKKLPRTTARLALDTQQVMETVK